MIKTDIPSLPMNKKQRRLYSGSSDPTYEHATFNDVLNYINTDPTAFLGQIIYCINQDALYRISKNDKGDLIPEGIGAALNAENVSYYNINFPELTNLKLAVDFILDNIGTGSSGSYNTFYYGISSEHDGINVPLTKEYILTEFKTQTFSLPNEDADSEIERENIHAHINFGVNTTPAYFYVAFPIVKDKKIKARDLSSGFGDGWFNWNEEENSNFLKTITLPNDKGLLQDYILLRSDNMLCDGRNWLFYLS